MSSDKVLKIGDEEYETIPETAVAASKWLVDLWETLGRPESPLTQSGEKLMNVIIAVWQELYPKDYSDWIEQRKDYKLSELDMKEQIRKHTGRSLASYPYHVFMIMKKVFPNFNAGERGNCMKMIRKYPLFKMANKA